MTHSTVSRGELLTYYHNFRSVIQNFSKLIVIKILGKMFDKNLKYWYLSVIKKVLDKMTSGPISSDSRPGKMLKVIMKKLEFKIE